jgi:hypothetical protein
MTMEAIHSFESFRGREHTSERSKNGIKPLVLFLADCAESEVPSASLGN